MGGVRACVCVCERESCEEYELKLGHILASSSKSRVKNVFNCIQNQESSFHILRPPHGTPLAAAIANKIH